jgi:predicted GIY-YIG superfamily endonuclease
MPPLSKHAILSAKLHSLNLPQGWATYLLICQDGSYYVGATENLPERILNHAEGKGGAHTKENPPVIFAWCEPHPSAESARQRERQLKGWSRTKKNSLVRASSPQFSFGLHPHLRLA